jgi:hypothetical protein
MIYATTDQIRTVIASDAVLLATLRDFFDTICGDLDADISMLLDELPGGDLEIFAVHRRSGLGRNRSARDVGGASRAHAAHTAGARLGIAP